MDHTAITALLGAMDGAKILKTVDGVSFVSAPKGYELKSLEGFQMKPDRVRQNVTLDEIESFIEFVKKFQIPVNGISEPSDPETVIFMDRESGKVIAVFDYHGSSYPVGASWRESQAKFNPKLDRRWKKWIDKDGLKMDQSDFAEFIESSLSDINQPTGAQMLEIATKFQLIRQAVYNSSIRLNSGEVQFQYSDEHTKGTVEIPEKITLAIPVFQGGGVYEVEARIRYRLKEQKLTFWYELINVDDVKEHAIQKIRDRITSEIEDVPVFMGSF